MKKVTIFLFAILVKSSFAQTTFYDFEVVRDVDNPNLFTVYAVADADATDAKFSSATVLFLVSTGVTLENITSLTGTGWGVNENLDIITAAQLTPLGLGDGTKDIVSILSAPGQTVISHNAGVRFGLVSFELVHSEPGVIEFIEDPSSNQLVSDVISLNFNLGNNILIDSLDGSGEIDRYSGNFLSDTLFDLDLEVLSVEENELVDFSVYPNPIKNSFAIEGHSGNSQVLDSIKLYSIAGVLVKDISPDSVDSLIDVNDLQSGVYFLQVVSGASSKTLKLLKR